MAEDKLHHINTIIRLSKDIGCVCVCSNNNLHKSLYQDAGKFEKMFKFITLQKTELTKNCDQGISYQYQGRACLFINYDNTTGVVIKTDMLAKLHYLTSLKCDEKSRDYTGGVNYTFYKLKPTSSKPEAVEWQSVTVGERETTTQRAVDQCVVIYPPQPPQPRFRFLSLFGNGTQSKGGNTLHINTDRNISKRYTKRRRTRK